MVVFTHLLNFKMETQQDIVVMDPTQQSLLLLITHNTFVCQLEIKVTLAVTQLFSTYLVSNCDAFIQLHANTEFDLVLLIIHTYVSICTNCVYMYVRKYICAYLVTCFSFVTIYSYVHTFKWCIASMCIATQLNTLRMYICVHAYMALYVHTI